MINPSHPNPTRLSNAIHVLGIFAFKLPLKLKHFESYFMQRMSYESVFFLNTYIKDLESSTHYVFWAFHQIHKSSRCIFPGRSCNKN